MQSGALSIRTRLSGQQKVKERERAKEMQALIEGTLDEYDRKKNKKLTRGVEKKLRGMDFMGEGADVIIEGSERGKRKKESVWERNLRQGQYSEALNYVLERGLPPLTVLTLLTAFRHRSAMRAAFQGRDENTVQPVLKWVCKHITNPQYVNICVDASLLLLDLYAEHVGDSPELEGNFKLLHRQVRLEVERSQQACKTSGMLEMLMTGLP
jgi:U3 small nucleolar RNA-associated protein 15